MTKPEAYSVQDAVTNHNSEKDHENNLQDPLSGSKKVKNRNHSRANQQSKGSGHR
ncbi:small acid-soluble spore protein P [Paenibacillus hexagrammi]|uniref:Small acid-soluble spore protein P n=1 Tax=Paenibacillus hexagrammi TaxID=2908839 RepID=A0ABY3SJZ6_9BACL|nr:small acid-soluble spore protein P [Paenibacillus sp. YPD9-1]UJF33297.1 small acid-soluble spore protein P [Paenibacillus sp. YPD9-1]